MFFCNQFPIIILIYLLCLFQLLRKRRRDQEVEEEGDSRSHYDPDEEGPELSGEEVTADQEMRRQVPPAQEYDVPRRPSAPEVSNTFFDSYKF